MAIGRLVEQADGRWQRNRLYHKLLKRMKIRVERRRARRNPECQPAYGRYNGFET
jgi:hypothetical protein